ncbi:MAG: chromosomal replication initiator protein DnaA [Alphaproteobacteria bacterium]
MTDSGRTNRQVEASWRRVRDRLRREIGNTTFERWIESVAIESMTETCAVMAVPTRFLCDWVAPRYGDRLRALWQTEIPAIQNVEFVVRSALAEAEERGGPVDVEPSENESLAPVDGDAIHRATHGTVRGASEATDGPGPFDSGDIGARLDRRYSFENFVVGKPNEFAHAAARRVGESDDVPFNPLFIYGGVGLGKTHLMHGIALRIRERRPERRVIYLSAEKFMYQFIRALRFKNIMGFKEMFRSVDVLLIDDVQFIGGKESTQEEFFHTFNALVDQNKQIVVSGDRSPADLEYMDERMRSRLSWGLVAEVHATSYELRLGILQAKAEQLGADQVPPKVLEFLAHKITSNIRELEGALIRVIAHSTLVGRPITLDGTHEVLHDLLRANDRRVTIEEIQKRVAEYYNIKVSEMSSARRAQMVARPRQVAMYLSKQLTSRSLPEIGRKFGNRDHTTVMHAVKRIDQLRQVDAGFAEDVELLRRMLEA